jgi:type I restriction enzyme S subunit
MKNVSKATLESMPVPVVEVTAQGEFVRRLDVVSRQRFKVQQALAADDRLFESLQSRAFNGSL